MSTTIIAFFNNKGRVGKTSLVYHLAWMYAELGVRVVAADLDPQANLTAAFLDEDRLEELWPDGDHPQTVFGCVQPLLQGTSDIAIPHLEDIEDRLALLVGDLALSGFEDELSDVWPKCLDSHPRAFRVISAFWRLMQKAAAMHDAGIILMDLGPNLGALSRGAEPCRTHRHGLHCRTACARPVLFARLTRPRPDFTALAQRVARTTGQEPCG